MNAPAIWKPSHKQDHRDRIHNRSSQLESSFLCDMPAGGSRWSHRGANYVPEQFRSEHARFCRPGTTVEVSSRITIIDIPFSNSREDMMFFQQHGHWDSTDEYTACNCFGIKFLGRKTRLAQQGLSFYFMVNGDTVMSTKKGRWANKHLSFINYDPVIYRDFLVMMRVKQGLDGKASFGGITPEKGKAEFFIQAIGYDDKLRSVDYVEGPTYFPFTGYPDAAGKCPTIGGYRCKQLQQKHCLFAYRNAQVVWLPEFHREPVITEIESN